MADTLIYVCQRSGDSACAQRTAELEVNALRTSKDVDPERLVRALLGLMYSRQQIHDYPGARATADEAMAIAARSETVSPDWAILENNAGGFYMFDGDLELAQQHLKRSLDIDAQLHNAESPSQAAAIGNLAYIELRLGHTAEALQDYPRARELFVKRFGPGHSQTALIDVGYGDALTYMGRYQEAIQLELDAHRVQREQIRLAIRLMPEQQALSMANIASQSFNTMVSVVTRRPEIDPAEVYQEVVRSRALVTEEMAQRQAVLNRKLDPAVEPLEKELDKERHAVMELQGTPAATEPPTVLTEATAKMEATERELAQRSAVFRADERKAATWPICAGTCRKGRCWFPMFPMANMPTSGPASTRLRRPITWPLCCTGTRSASGSTTWETQPRSWIWWRGCGLPSMRKLTAAGWARCATSGSTARPAWSCASESGIR